EPEAHPLVVPGRDAGERRLAGADHVPPRSDEVHDVAQRRHADRSMWVVRKQGFTGRGAGGAHDPVVRPLEPPVAHVSRSLLQGSGADPSSVNSMGWWVRMWAIQALTPSTNARTISRASGA